MNSEGIETFLEVAECGSLTEAAGQLLVSQGTVSMRIAQLEEELGVPLLVRQRGIKKVLLTPEGEVFLTLAHQWVGLEQQAHEIKSLLAFRELRVAAVDTINTYTFSELYPSFIRSHPRTKLFIQTEHSTEIHRLIEEQAIDIGFAFTLHKSKSVISRPLYKEDMVLVCHKDARFVDTGSTEDLDEMKEIRSTVSSDFEIWHRRRFAGFMSCYVTVGTVSMLSRLLEEPGTWTIVTRSVADLFARSNPDLAVVPFVQDPPPERIAYLLFYRYPRPWVEQMSNEFLEDVIDLIEKSPELELC